MGQGNAGARLRALDGLRGFAAAGVVLLHVWMFSVGDARHPPPALGDYFARELRLGVMLFFVLSGYLLYRPWLRAALDRREPPRLSVYALRRAARILPAYWFALAGSYAITRAIDHPLQRDSGELWAYLLFVQNYVGSAASGLDPPMWSLVVEVSFYVVLPLLGWIAVALALRAGRWAQLAFCALLVAIGIGLNTLAHLGDWPRTVLASLPFLLPYFAIGMAVAVVLHRRAWSRRTGALLLLLGCALVVADGWWHVHRELPLRHELRDVPAGVGFGLVVAALVATPLRARLLTCAPAQALGALSYGLYLWHFPVLILVRHLDLWPRDGLAAQFAVVFAVTLVPAAISWFALERPAIRWARRRAPG